MKKKSKRWQGSLKQAITASTVGTTFWNGMILPYMAMWPLTLARYFSPLTTRLRRPLHLAMGLFAGTAPMVAEWMLKSKAWELGPAFYMVIWLAIGLWSIGRCEESAFKPLD